MQSGATEAANLTTLSRANYEADFARALAGATGTLRQDLWPSKAAYLSAMTAGKFDLKSSVVESAFESECQRQGADPGHAQRHARGRQRASPIASPQRLELTMVHSGGKWLAADLFAVGVQ